MRSVFSIAQVIPSFKDGLTLTTHQERTLGALERCRTAWLGGHVDACPSCGVTRISYNSCRNRHCPLCQGTQRERWVEARRREVLKVKYYHVVFTVPPALHPLFFSDKALLYGILFKAAWQTLGKFGKRQGLQLAMTCLLHTWGSNLHYHPHLHCIVPAGGMGKQGKWKELPGANNETPYLFPVKAMSKVFRGKFVHLIKEKGVCSDPLRKELYQKDWVVYCKRPLRTGDVIRYLGRYSHRVALTNRRIKDITATHVTFEYKNYKQQGRMCLMTLTGVEFLRRFTQHILPPRFVRIRHYGLLASCNRDKLHAAQQQAGTNQQSGEGEATRQDEQAAHTRPNSYLCPDCGKDYMRCISLFKPGRPPPDILLTIKPSPNKS